MTNHCAPENALVLNLLFKQEILYFLLFSQNQNWMLF